MKTRVIYKNNLYWVQRRFMFFFWIDIEAYMCKDIAKSIANMYEINSR